MRRDREILSKIHKAEGLPKLTDNEKFLLLFIRTQLEKDWRSHILALLDKMLERKKNSWNSVKKKALKSFWQPK